MRVPSRWVRLGLASVGVGLLVAVLLDGTFGPLSISSQTSFHSSLWIQSQILAAGSVLSAMAIVGASWRSTQLSRLLPVILGFAGLLSGAYLAFGYTVPNHGNATSYGWVAPFTLQGADLLLWGLALVLLGTVSMAGFHNATRRVLPSHPVP